jgi:hypothetical protein
MLGVTTLGKMTLGETTLGKTLGKLALYHLHRHLYLVPYDIVRCCEVRGHYM